VLLLIGFAASFRRRPEAQLPPPQA
jgi:hypothetical protein